MRKIASVCVTKTQSGFRCWIVGKLNGAKIGAEVGSVSLGIVTGVIVPAAPDVVTHISPLSGSLGKMYRPKPLYLEQLLFLTGKSFLDYFNMFLGVLVEIFLSTLKFIFRNLRIFLGNF